MFPIIFDGRAFANKKIDSLKSKVSALIEKNITPRLVVFLVGEDKASHLYVNLKKTKAEDLGIVCTVYKFDSDISKTQLINQIKDANRDSTIHGIMVQLPLPKNLSKDTDDILNFITKEKDVDGLRGDSKFAPAAAVAVTEIVQYAQLQFNFGKYAAVVGANGRTGRAIVKELTRLSFDVVGLDIKDDLKSGLKNADLIVSATGVPNLITPELIDWDQVVIDLGSPKGDVEFERVKGVANFVTPVPGGVGPVTISALLENLIKAASNIS